MANNFFKTRNGVNIGSLPSAPANPADGDIYYDTTLEALQAYQNGAWGYLSSLANPMTTAGDTIYGGAGGTPERLGIGTTGQVSAVVSGDPVWATVPGNSAILKSPTVQQFLFTGTTTGYLFTISTSSTCAAGDTYTNNGNTYTVLYALSSQSGQVLLMSQPSAPTASGTLTRTSGSGTSSIVFTSSVALATYTLPSGPAPLYLRVRMVGGGGGGGGSTQQGGGNPASNGVAGTVSTFGNAFATGGGRGGSADTTAGAPGTAGGFATLGTGMTGLAVTGDAGSAGATSANSNFVFAGGAGGSTYFGPGGKGALSNPGNNASTNSGGGGEGGSNAGSGGGSTGANSGGGGGAGGFVDAIIRNPSATYPYIVGTGGSGAPGGSDGGLDGGAGAAGQIIVEEFYQ